MLINFAYQNKLLRRSKNANMLAFLEYDVILSKIYELFVAYITLPTYFLVYFLIIH